MVELPRIELKKERDELIKFWCRSCYRRPDYYQMKASFTRFVYKMGNQNVLDCLAVVQG